MVNRKLGFTLVELIVVIVVIAILATIGVVAFSKTQADSRDAARSTRATIISEALEKYYDEHGEYPSCSQLTQLSSTVASSVLKGIDTAVLKTPTQEATDNSLTCDDLTSPSDGDYFSYTGDSSSTCTGPAGSACTLYTLKYINEGTGEIASISSRRKTGLSASDVPVISVSASGLTQLSVSWTAISGSINYTVQYSTTSTFPADPTVLDANTSSSGTFATGSSTSKAISSLTYNTQYYIRVRAENSAGPGNWSETKTVTTRKIGDIASVTGTTDNSTQVTFSWTSSTNASSYTLEYSTSAAFTSPTTVNTSSLTTTLTGLTTGTTYYARVRGVNGTYNGDWSSTATAIAGLNAPSLTATAASTTSINLSWPALTAATGYVLERSTSSSFSSITTTTIDGGATTSSTASSLIPATTYYFRLRGTIGSYQGPDSTTKSAVTLTPNVVLSGPQYCSGAYSGRPAFHLRLQLQEVSYNLTANTSNVSWSLYRIRVSTYSGTYDQTKTWPWSVNINGSSWSGSSNSIVFKNNSAIGATESIASGSLTVTHNTDGTKTISFSASDGPGSNIFGSASCSSTYTLSKLR